MLVAIFVHATNITKPPARECRRLHFFTILHNRTRLLCAPISYLFFVKLNLMLPPKSPTRSSQKVIIKNCWSFSFTP